MSFPSRFPSTIRLHTHVYNFVSNHFLETTDEFFRLQIPVVYLGVAVMSAHPSSKQTNVVQCPPALPSFAPTPTSAHHVGLHNTVSTASFGHVAVRLYMGVWLAGGLIKSDADHFIYQPSHEEMREYGIGNGLL